MESSRLLVLRIVWMFLWFQYLYRNVPDVWLVTVDETLGVFGVIFPQLVSGAKRGNVKQ